MTCLTGILQEQRVDHKKTSSNIFSKLLPNAYGVRLSSVGVAAMTLFDAAPS